MNTNSSPSLSNYIDLLLDAICVVDRNGHFEFVSAGAERIFGYTPAEMLGRQMLELVHPDDRARTLAAATDINHGAVKVDFENRYIRKDGSVVHLLWSARWSELDQRRVAVARDISRSKLAEARQSAIYAISEAAFASDDLAALYQSIQNIISRLLPTRRFVIVLTQPESATLKIVHSASMASANVAPSQFDYTILCADVIRRAETIQLGVPTLADLPLRLQPFATPDNGIWLGVPLKSHSAVIGAMVLQHTDSKGEYSCSEIELLEYVSVQITLAIERKQMLARLQRSALYDHLTQLPNRELLYDRLQRALHSAQRQQTQFALMYLDLDKFKQVNDNHGHHAGDVLLQQVAGRITHCLRQTDTVARFGGDEFVILLADIDSVTTALQLAEKVLTALAVAYAIAELSLTIAPSIGVAIYPQHGKTAHLLLNAADNAMYRAKTAGGNQVMLHPIS